MKKILVIVTMLITFNAFAQTVGTGTQSNDKVSGQAVSQAGANSGSASQSSNQGNSNNITFSSPAITTQAITSSGTLTQNVSGTTTQNLNNVISGTQTQNVNYSGTQTVRNTPSVSGPNLASSNDTCMGAASGAVNAPGFGLSLGKTYTDNNCVILKNSRELWNMGMKGAALALMCSDSANKDALELTGYECPQTTKAKKEQVGTTYESVKVQSSEQYNDPIVRARLGLPELASK